MSGGTALAGRVRVTGAKNSALKLMAAALLAPGRTTLDEVPDILDVSIMSEVLRRLGCDVSYERYPAGSGGGGRVHIDVPEQPSSETDYDLVRRMRASISVLGPLVARLGMAKVALPGGDAIGSRGLDMHIAGLERLGATIVNEHGFLIATAPRLVGTSIWLDFPSVGATENLVMAAVLAEGTTVVDNAAREPEIVDLCRMLVAMGARIEGAGTPSTVIVDVPAPSIWAPIAVSIAQMSAISGSRAALSMTVVPWARTAAMTRFSVAPTEGKSNQMLVPRRRGAAATRKPCSLCMVAPSRSRPEMCMSSPREPIASPPGSATLAEPHRATSGPSTLIEARIRRTRS